MSSMEKIENSINFVLEYARVPFVVLLICLSLENLLPNETFYLSSDDIHTGYWLALWGITVLYVGTNMVNNCNDKMSKLFWSKRFNFFTCLLCGANVLHFLVYYTRYPPLTQEYLSEDLPIVDDDWFHFFFKDYFRVDRRVSDERHAVLHWYFFFLYCVNGGIGVVLSLLANVYETDVFYRLFGFSWNIMAVHHLQCAVSRLFDLNIWSRTRFVVEESEHHFIRIGGWILEIVFMCITLAYGVILMRSGKNKKVKHMCDVISACQCGYAITGVIHYFLQNNDTPTIVISTSVIWIYPEFIMFYNHYKNHWSNVNESLSTQSSTDVKAKSTTEVEDHQELTNHKSFQFLQYDRFDLFWIINIGGFAWLGIQYVICWATGNFDLLNHLFVSDVTEQCSQDIWIHSIDDASSQNTHQSCFGIAWSLYTCCTVFNFILFNCAWNMTKNDQVKVMWCALFLHFVFISEFTTNIYKQGMIPIWYTSYLKKFYICLNFFGIFLGSYCLIPHYFQKK